ncbi:MAG: prefoldin subunit alpha [Candidatus Aenigmarchaeota archaeon]|nr:prefoldin subunit alpha [Candidatus Aenigmarchaeota archaeon]
MPDIKVPKKMLEEEKKEDSNEMQNEVILYQLLHRQLNQLSAEAESVERKAVEAAATKQSLKELKSPNDLLMPIGSGCYVHGKFSNAKQVLVDIGAGVLLPKNPADAEAFIADREAQITRLKAELQGEAAKIVNEMNRIATKVKR